MYSTTMTGAVAACCRISNFLSYLFTAENAERGEDGTGKPQPDPGKGVGITHGYRFSRILCVLRGLCGKQGLCVRRLGLVVTISLFSKEPL